ncbi:hypothetical protein BD289DRAFT_20531 [Coniella lustricola]|uniref:Secreted protein n=1 Tax=Coniella lustricola TaxID=2025994 RepID=A0A2T3A3N1_9PEZI|nr:hypothetical protein BD289DRAFT_20531 [Coniella lustricola]
MHVQWSVWLSLWCSGERLVCFFKSIHVHTLDFSSLLTKYSLDARPLRRRQLFWHGLHSLGRAIDPVMAFFFGAREGTSTECLVCCGNEARSCQLLSNKPSGQQSQQK